MWADPWHGYMVEDKVAGTFIAEQGELLIPALASPGTCYGWHQLDTSIARPTWSAWTDNSSRNREEYVPSLHVMADPESIRVFIS
jgi:hypothetical protein